MNSKLALMPLVVASAFAYAADEATSAPEAYAEVQEVKVHADAKTRQSRTLVFYCQ